MRIKTTLVLVTLFYTGHVGASCLVQAKTEYEKIYCDIVDRGEGKALPRFEDFKRNDVMVQKLLLKRPAAKLKIALPALLKMNTSATPSAPGGAIKPDQLQPSSNSPAEPDEPSRSVTPNLSLSQCDIAKNHITCGYRRFELKKNEPNSGLTDEVLDDQYLMGLPRYSGPVDDTREVQFYLSDVYGLYLQRMIDIGLGASTMSYARFYHTFQDLQVKNVDFSERFETMYRFLKKDKRTMAVKAEPSDQRPKSISQCDDITEQIIVCDIGVVNWVYVN